MATYTNPHTASNNGTAITSVTVTATTIGNLGIIAFSHDHATAISSVTGGGTWARIGTVQNSAPDGQDAEFWYTVFTSSVTSISFSSINAAAVSYCEFNSDVGFAASPLDVSNTAKAFANTSLTTDAETSNSITPAATGELFIAAAYDQAGTGPTWTQGTGWTLGVAVPGLSGRDGSSAIEWKTGSTGAQSATWTINKSGDHYTVQIAAFKPAAGGGTTKAISGTVNATSALSGTLVRIRPLSGTVNATSALSGSIARIRLIAGTINATSNLSGAVVRIRQIAGTINATSSLSGALTFFGQTRAISGTINALSDLSGTLPRIRSISGSFSMTSSLSGSLVAQRAISGTINATSTLSGVVSLVGQTATQFISNHFPIIQMFQKKR